MFGYLVRRAVSAVLVLFVTSLAVFALFTYGPSDPAQAMCQGNRCTEARLDTIRDSLGLEDPLLKQYGEYMKGIFVGREISVGTESWQCDAPCFGRSFIYGVDVTDFLASKMPATISVAVLGAATAITIGLTFGVYAARKRGTVADKGVVGLSLLINAIPYYLLALLAYLYLVTSWGIFPDTGYVPLTENPGKWLYALILPCFVLGLYNSTQYARFSRGSMIESLSNDYVRTARAKGLPERRVVFRHGLRAAVVPVVTIFGLDFAMLLTGTIFTERIFGIDGIGYTAVEAVDVGDLPIIQATALLTAFVVVVANVVVDIVYSILDPRVRLS